MIATSFRRGPFRLKVYRYCERPALRHAFGLTAYLHSTGTGPALGYVRRRTATLLIDLTASEKELLKACNESTAYKIRRAQRDGVEFGLETDRDRFMTMFNAFAAARGIAPVRRADLDPYGDALVITKATLAGETVAIHSYLCDPESKRVRLAQSASVFRDADDSGQRNLIGRANRFLHFRDMVHFKELGYRVYDMGGYAPDSPDPELRKIAQFKEGFGGRAVAETDYFSLPHHAYRLCRDALRRGSRRPSAPA